MSKSTRGLLLVVLVLCAVPARAQEPRLDFSNPIVGESMEIVVDRVPPGATVAMVAETVDGLPLEQQARPADASGCARFEFLVPPAAANQILKVRATLAGGISTEPRMVRFQWPQLLATGSRGGNSWLYRIEVVGSADRDASDRFRLVREEYLGAGEPGGAVRDGRGSRTFVVSDASGGVISIVPDLELGAGEITTLLLPANIRGITRTADGSKILVTSAASGTDAVLTVIDAAAAEAAAVATVAIGPLGDSGGKIAVSEDGLYAFVAVDGLWVSQVNLLRNEVGCPISVGGRGLDRIRDLRIVDGSLFVLTGGADQVNYLTGYEVGALQNWHVAGPVFDGAGIGVGSSAGDSSVLLLNGAGGEISVIDARTLDLRGGPFPVPPGASALLLTPNPGRRSGHLLYEEPENARLLPLDFDRFAVGEAFRLGFPGRQLPVNGTSRQVDWLFLIAPVGTIYAVHPDRRGVLLLPLPTDLVGLSISVI